MQKAPAAFRLWVPFILSGKKSPFRLAQGDGTPAASLQMPFPATTPPVKK